jgi:hypothetical protein
VKKAILTPLLVACAALLVLGSDCAGGRDAIGKDPPATSPSLPVVAEDVDEFYARVDKVNSPTELAVTILDVWQPSDKTKGPRWPEGKARVQPAKRIVNLEDTIAPPAAQDRKAAVDFILQALKESANEIVCTGSSVTKKKESGNEIVCVTGYVFVKKGFTLNNALVRQGLATTANPFYKSWEEEARKNKRGMWRDKP